MKKLAILLITTCLVITSFTAYAQVENVAPLPTTTTQQEVTIKESLWSNAFKALSRNTQRLFTFNQEKRVALELSILEEEADRLSKIGASNLSSDNVEKALSQYVSNANRLQQKLEGLRDKNPNVDKLLTNVTSRIVEHEEVLGRIIEDRKLSKGKIADISGEVLKSSASKFTNPSEFGSRLKDAILNNDGDDDTEIRAFDLVNRIEKNGSEEVKNALASVKSDVATRLSSRVKADSNLENKVADLIKKLPDGEAKINLIRDLATYSEGRVKNNLEDAAKDAEKNNSNINEVVAKKAIEVAKGIIEEATKKLGEGKESLLDNAKKHLKEAEDNLANQKFGAAFGQARSAEVIAKNVLRQLENKDPKKDLENIVSNLEREYSRLVNLISKLPSDKKDAFNVEALKTEIENLKNKEEGKTIRQKLIELELSIRKMLDKKDSNRENKENKGIICAQVYAPVCGEDGKTYSNECMAKGAGVKIKAMSACEEKVKMISPQQGMPVPSGDLNVKEMEVSKNPTNSLLPMPKPPLNKERSQNLPVGNIYGIGEVRPEVNKELIREVNGQPIKFGE